MCCGGLSFVISHLRRERYSGARGHYQAKKKEQAMNAPTLPHSGQMQRLSLQDPSSCDTSKRQKAADQAQSVLFRLPPEIRILIYHKVVYCGIIHITPIRGGLVHTKCGHILKDRDMSRCAYGTWHIVPQWGYPVPDLSRQDGAVLALLKTCQRVYVSKTRLVRRNIMYLLLG
jgi:hypothetical protein